MRFLLVTIFLCASGLYAFDLTLNKAVTPHSSWGMSTHDMCQQRCQAQVSADSRDGDFHQAHRSPRGRLAAGHGAADFRQTQAYRVCRNRCLAGR